MRSGRRQADDHAPIWNQVNMSCDPRRMRAPSHTSSMTSAMYRRCPRKSGRRGHPKNLQNKPNAKSDLISTPIHGVSPPSVCTNVGTGRAAASAAALPPHYPLTIVRRTSERSAARLAHQSGGLGVASSNLAAPTKRSRAKSGGRCRAVAQNLSEKFNDFNWSAYPSTDGQQY